MRKNSRGMSVKERMGHVIHEFAGITTCHGLARIIEAESLLARLLWSIITCASLGAFIFGGCQLFIQYHNHPYTTKVDVIGGEILPFPQVTVCNLNILRRSKLHGSRFEELLDIDETTDYSLLVDKLSFNTQFDSGMQDVLRDFPDDVLRNLTFFSSDSSIGSEEITAYDSFLSSESAELWNKRQEWEDNYDSFYDWFFENDTIFNQNWTNFIDVLDEDKIESWAEIINPTREEAAELGHQAKDFILQCTYNKHSCSYRDFERNFVPGLGNCYTFNIAVNDSSKVRKTRKTGTTSGLQLTLFIEQAEYIGFLSPEVGVKVSVSPPYHRAFPNVDGIALAPGFSTFIGLRQSSLIRLGEPYGDCKKREDDIEGYNYTIAGCLNRCLDNFTFRSCNCHTDSMYGVPQCNTQSRRDRACLSIVRDVIFDLRRSRCECTKPCKEVSYTKTISSVEWPSRRFQNHLMQMLINKSAGIVEMLKNNTVSKQNLIRLKVYFQELNYENIEQIPLYSIETLLSAVGGLMGLCIGLSVISLFEFISLFKSLVERFLMPHSEIAYIQNFKKEQMAM